LKDHKKNEMRIRDELKELDELKLELEKKSQDKICGGE